MHARSVRILASLLSIALASASVPALAEDKAMSVKLFDDAKKLMDAGNFAEACPKLEASRQMDPAADGVVLRLAACYQSLGKWAKAWGLYKESLVRAQKAKRQDRIDASKKGIAETEPKMSYVIVRVSGDGQVPGLEIKWDDKPLDTGAWGSAFPVDPGEHTVAASAPGYKRWDAKLSISVTSESRTIEVPKLEIVPAPAPAVTSAPPSSIAPPVAPLPSGDAKSTNTVAYLAIGSGVVLVAGGVGAHLMARSARDDYFAGCAEQRTVTCEDAAGRSRVRTWEAVSFVAGGLGLAAIGVGVVLIATRKNEASPKSALVASPMLAGSGAGFSLVGTF
jgi:hypothetical protein